MRTTRTKLNQTLLAGAIAAGMLATGTAQAATLTSYDMQFVITNGPSSGIFNDLSVAPGAEANLFGVSFDMLDSTGFTITWAPTSVAHSDLYVYISDLRFSGVADPADILTLALDSGDASPIYAVIANAPDTPGGAPAMQFNIDRDGSFDAAPGSWTFAYTTDVTPVPLPAGLPLAVAGLGALAWLRRRKQG